MFEINLDMFIMERNGYHQHIEIMKAMYSARSDLIVIVLFFVYLNFTSASRLFHHTYIIQYIYVFSLQFVFSSLKFCK